VTPNPLLYEINTRCWLRELSERAGRPLTLASVPDVQLDEWRQLGFTHVWLMGVWGVGPQARTEALRHADLRRRYTEALPDWQRADVIGSPYAVADYRVMGSLGGDVGLEQFRRRLNARGLKLVLDFVPNHLGLDHEWLRQKPELFVQTQTPTAGTFPRETGGGTVWIAHGKDPFFPPWTDTAQLDYRRAATRTEMTRLLESVTRRCDGVRCDMAMLVLKDIFHENWGRFPVPADVGAAAGEFWQDSIAAVKQSRPGFLFLAEAYWGTEATLQRLGFDYTYDKTLYDHLMAHDTAGAGRYLLGLPADRLKAGAHFLENHDEKRVASLLTPAEHRAAALLVLGLPGMRFLHDGQLSGARTHIPVQLGRRAPEPPDPGVVGLYRELLATLAETSVGRGSGELLRPRAAGAGHPTVQSILVVQWQAAAPDFQLVVVNLAPSRSQAVVPLNIPRLDAQNWSVENLLSAEHFVRAGNELRDPGLHLDLPPHAAQLFRCRPA
jgi:hypothetical protein